MNNSSNTPPTVEERYTSAVNTSNLKVEADRSNVADVLVAAGWSRSKLGAALQRLHSEWDGSEKPPKPTALAISQLEASLPLPVIPAEVTGRERAAQQAANVRERAKLAQATATKWHVHDLGLLFQKLKTLPEARERLTFWARAYGMDDAAAKVAAVLSFWLDHTCRTCHGAKWELIPGTNRHSSRACKACKGRGEMALPHGLEGRRIESEITEAVRASANSMSARLRPYMRSRS